MPFGGSLGDLQVKRVQFVEFLEFALRLDQSGVVLVGKGEQGLASLVRVVLSVVHRELLLEILEFVEGFSGGQVSLHGSILHEVFSKFDDIFNQLVDVQNEGLLESGLNLVLFVSHLERFGHEFVPLLLQVLLFVELVTIQVGQVLLNEHIHVLNGLKLEVNV